MRSGYVFSFLVLRSAPSSRLNRSAAKIGDISTQLPVRLILWAVLPPVFLYVCFTVLLIVGLILLVVFGGVAARSLMTMGPYRPFKLLKNLRVPTLLLGATEDTVAPFVESSVRRANNPHIRVATVKANHFEPYFEPVFSEVIRCELDFLESLKVT